MAGAAGRRNILRELIAVGDNSVASNIQSTLVPATPTSPDETVIQNRGHIKKAATYNYGAPDPVFFKTPTKSPQKVSLLYKLQSPTKTPVRSSPRKRLGLTPEKMQCNEAGIAELSLSSKRLKKGQLEKVKPSNQFEKGLNALSRAQLVDLICNAVKESPPIYEVVHKLFPEPDLTPIEERLHMLQRSVYKSFPRNVWGTQDGSFCYLRVKTHLEAFKKECLEMCRQYVDSQHWPAALEYIFLAWKLTMGLPDWSDAAYNKIKIICMKQLSAQCVSVLKKANLDHSAISEIIERMKEFSHDQAVVPCITFASELLQSSSLNNSIV